MALITSKFFSGSPGDCPICGAPNSTCKGGSGVTAYQPPERIHITEQAMRHQFVSTIQVWHKNPQSGQDELRYGVGSPIPLLEALKQGIIKVTDLSDAQKNAIKEHAEKNPAEVKEILRGLKRAVKDRAMKAQQVVTKDTKES